MAHPAHPGTTGLLSMIEIQDLRCIALLWKRPFHIEQQFDKHNVYFSVKVLIIIIKLFKTISRAYWDFGLTAIFG